MKEIENFPSGTSYTNRIILIRIILLFLILSIAGLNFALIAYNHVIFIPILLKFSGNVLSYLYKGVHGTCLFCLKEISNPFLKSLFTISKNKIIRHFMWKSQEWFANILHAGW